MQEILTWVGALAGLGSVIAVVRFWMNMGATEEAAKAARKQAEEAMAQITAHRVHSASEFATAKALGEAERRFATALETITGRFDRMAERLDRVLETLLERRDN